MMTLSRRQMLQLMGVGGVATALAACAPVAPVAPATSGGSEATAPEAAATDIAIWIHWGGVTGEYAKQLIDGYNSGQGVEDKINVVIEHVPNSNEVRQKLTASRQAGTPGDVYHTSIPILELVTNEIIAELPDDDQAYVRDNYIKAAVDRMTFEGKIWGFPTEHQAPAFMYRRSLLEKFGVEAPTTAEEAREIARAVTHEEGGIKYYGFTQWYDGFAVNYHLPGIVWRHGGELWEMDGDVPVRMNCDAEETIAAVNWWRGFVEDGTTQVGEMPFTDAWQNGFAIMGEMEPWFPFLQLRDAGAMEIFDDLGIVPLPPAQGIGAVSPAIGFELVHDRMSEHPAECIKFMQWMMHKPDMPMSRFIVETVGSLPAPLDYPSPITGWSEAMQEGYAIQTAPITRADPILKSLGIGEIVQAVREVMEGIMLQQTSVEEGLMDLQARTDAILERTDAPRRA